MRSRQGASSCTSQYLPITTSPASPPSLLSPCVSSLSPSPSSLSSHRTSRLSHSPFLRSYAPHWFDALVWRERHEQSRGRVGEARNHHDDDGDGGSRVDNTGIAVVRAAHQASQVGCGSRDTSSLHPCIVPLSRMRMLVCFIHAVSITTRSTTSTVITPPTRAVTCSCHSSLCSSSYRSGGKSTR